MAKSVHGPRTRNPQSYNREEMNSANNPHELEAESSPESPERKEARPTLISLCETLSGEPGFTLPCFWPGGLSANKWLLVSAIESCHLTQQRKADKICRAIHGRSARAGSGIPRPEDVSLLSKEG